MKNIGDGVQFSEESGVDKEKASQWASVQGYYDMLAEAYLKLIGPSSIEQTRSLVVDASCGVGGTQLPHVVAQVNKQALLNQPELNSATAGAEVFEDTSKKLKVEAPSEALQVTLLNNVGEGELNEACGAEYVQKGRTPPVGWGAPDMVSGVLKDKRLCSIDGDGDRLVYHFFDKEGT